jgi:putative transposase
MLREACSTSFAAALNGAKYFGPIRVSKLFDLDVQQILLSGKQPLRVKAKSLVCYWVVKELGMAATEVAKKLHITQPAVSKAVQRGEKLALNNKFSLID